jgi:glycosyltransferase involved in cell wall biosynthesis
VREVCGVLASYFLCNDEGALADKLLEALNLTPDDRQKKAGAGRERAQQFSWQRAAVATSEVLRRVLGS